MWVSEHHVTDDGYIPSVFPLLAAIAQRTRTMRLGSAILLGPFQHPIRFAEDVAFERLVRQAVEACRVGQDLSHDRFPGLRVDPKLDLDDDQASLGLDGDEIGYLVAKVAEIKRQK